MVTLTLHGKNGSRTIEVKSPLGFPTRHIRAPREINPPSEARHHNDSDRVTSQVPPPAPETPCPVLAVLLKLTKRYTSDGYFILDEIFRVVRQEGTDITRDALLETLRSHYRDGKIDFRPGYGSQLQFALKGRRALKKVLSLDALAELARVYLKSAWIAAPQWDAEKKAWVRLSPHGTSTSSCEVVEFSGIPKTDADIKPHQRVMWQECRRCGLIRPWGGCSWNKYFPPTTIYTPGGKR